MTKENPFNIVVQNPGINNNVNADFLYRRRDLEIWPKTLFELKENNITPGRYKKLLDVCAGKGSAAALFEELGWTDITCVDFKIPQTVLPKKSAWLFWNLTELGKAVREGEDFDPKIFGNYQQKFDLVANTFPEGEVTDYIAEIGLFFVKPGGLYYTPNDYIDLDRNPEIWRRIGNARYFHQRIG